jgi:hypothetical protein
MPIGNVKVQLKETQFVVARLKRLFPLVAKETWAKAVRALPDVDGMSTWDVALFCQKVAVARNAFLHRGNKWAVGESMPLDCVQNLPRVLQLFVALHNRYIAKPIATPGNHGAA